MSNKIKKILTLIIIIIIGVALVWFILLKPEYTFKSYEKTVEEAAKEYFVQNSSLLPTGKRTATVSLKTLYNKAFLKEDMYIPYTTTACSVTDSWVKVQKKNGKYIYKTYLKCGLMESNVDHEGPTIKLKGKDSITIELGDEYKEQGVTLVKDNNDGIIDTKDVKISGTVDNNTIGTYEIKYTAVDSLANKTTVTRKVTVIETLKTTIKKQLGNEKYYKGNDANNYIKLSNMLFRIIKIDENKNIQAIAEMDVTNINYTGINDWLNTTYKNSFTKEAKKLLVNGIYCNDIAEEDSTDTECNSYKKDSLFSIVSIKDLNATKDVEGNTYLKPGTISWVISDKNNQYATRSFFYLANYQKSFIKVENTDNYGLRPIITIKGSTKLTSGDGTRDNPYKFDETKTKALGSNLNTRYTGEYISYSGYIWRIISTEKDGTTKAITVTNLYTANESRFTTYSKVVPSIYNPTKKGSIGYTLNNKVTTINTDYLVNHEIEVPIYKDIINYKKETTTKKYKAVISAPNMYDMFSTIEYTNEPSTSYFYINSSKNATRLAVISEDGSVLNGEINNLTSFGLKAVVYFDKNVVIGGGGGTYENPYIVKK